MFSAGEWREPAAEHWAALEAAGWEPPVLVGLIGDEQQREGAASWLSAQPLRSEVVAWADEGYEHVTIDALHRYAKLSEGAIMYAHTKGAYNTAPIEHAWRQYMTEHLVGEWVTCRTALEQGYDVAGPCYLAGAEAAGHGFLRPIFGGNFWMATCEHLRSLPPLVAEERHEAEIWVCQNQARAFSTAPFAGW